MAQAGEAGGGHLDDAVRSSVEAVIGPVTVVAPLAGGVMNAAFEVHTASAPPVVVRVAQRAVPHFEAERQTLDLLAPHDLPTPRVLALDHHRAADGTLSVIVLSKLEGRQLGQLEEIDGATDDTLVELGRLLARIHLATLEPDVAEHPGWLADWLDDSAWMQEGAALANVDPAYVEAAVDVVRVYPRPTGPRARIHNDFKSGNIPHCQRGGDRDRGLRVFRP